MSRMLWISRQPFDPLSQRRIIGAGLVEVSSPLGGIILFQRGDKDGSFAHGDVSRSESCPAGVAPSGSAGGIDSYSSCAIDAEIAPKKTADCPGRL